MNVSARTYLTSGIAAVGAGAIALTPIQPLPAQMPLASAPAVKNMAVELASTIDPITPWVDTFKTSAANIKALTAFYLEQPFPLIQTIAKNQATYVQALPDLQFITQSIANNAKNFFLAPWWNKDGAPIPNGTYASQYISNTETVGGVAVLFDSQKSVYNVTAPVLAASGPAWLGPFLEFTATPYSSQVLGLLAPTLSSLAQLTRSFTAFGQFIQDGDVTGAINELINIPANVTNASLNGAGLVDLTEVIKSLVPESIVPLIKEFGVNLGGWITPPVPFDGSLVNANKPPTEYTGGTMFDGIQTKLSIGADTTGLKVGFVDSVIGMGQFLGDNLLVTPPPAPTAAVAPAAATPAVPAAPATPAVPATKDDPAIPAIPATRATPAVPDVDSEAPSPQSHQDSSAAGSDNAGNGGGHAKRAARSGRG